MMNYFNKQQLWFSKMEFADECGDRHITVIESEHTAIREFAEKNRLIHDQYAEWTTIVCPSLQYFGSEVFYPEDISLEGNKLKLTFSNERELNRATYFLFLAGFLVTVAAGSKEVEVSV